MDGTIDLLIVQDCPGWLRQLEANFGRKDEPYAVRTPLDGAFVAHWEKLMLVNQFIFYTNLKMKQPMLTTFCEYFGR